MGWTEEGLRVQLGSRSHKGPWWEVGRGREQLGLRRRRVWMVWRGREGSALGWGVGTSGVNFWGDRPYTSLL